MSVDPAVTEFIGRFAWPRGADRHTDAARAVECGMVAHLGSLVAMARATGPDRRPAARAVVALLEALPLRAAVEAYRAHGLSRLAVHLEYTDHTLRLTGIATLGFSGSAEAVAVLAARREAWLADHVAEALARLASTSESAAERCRELAASADPREAALGARALEGPRSDADARTRDGAAAGLRAGDSATRLLSLGLLSHLPCDRGLAPEIERLVLGDPAAEVRAAAVRTWAEMAAENVDDVLLKALNDGDGSVASEALHMLKWRADAEPEPVARAVHGALLRGRASAALVHVLAGLRLAADERVRCAAFDALVLMTDDPDARVAQAAADEVVWSTKSAVRHERLAEWAHGHDDGWTESGRARARQLLVDAEAGWGRAARSTTALLDELAAAGRWQAMPDPFEFALALRRASPDEIDALFAGPRGREVLLWAAIRLPGAMAARARDELLTRLGIDPADRTQWPRAVDVDAEIERLTYRSTPPDLRDADPEEMLESRWRQTNAWVQSQAADVLGIFGVQSARPALERALRHRDARDSREAIERALARLDGREPPDPAPAVAAPQADGPTDLPCSAPRPARLPGSDACRDCGTAIRPIHREGGQWFARCAEHQRGFSVHYALLAFDLPHPDDLDAVEAP